MKRSILALLGLVAAPLIASPASAQTVCAERNEIVSRLENGYHEMASAIGVSGNGGVIELYTSSKGSWTLILTQPDGVSCLIAAGESWESVTAARPASQKVY